MGIGIASVQNLLELHNLGFFKDKKKVIEIGSQELHLKKDDLLELFESAGLDKNKLEDIPNLKNWPFSPRTSSKFLYNLLDISDYQSIDLSGELGAIVHDLNYPFEDKSKYNMYDIVTDFGSCEHVFNVGECYKTMHKLVKPGGYIIIDQAYLKGNGFFKFDETFFDGVAAANMYKILYNSYVITTGDKTSNGSNNQFHIPRNQKLLNVLDFSKLGEIEKSQNIGIYAVMQKTEDSDFKIPYEYTLMNEVYNIAGFNRLYTKEPLAYAHIQSATLKIEQASLTQIIKALINWFKIKIKRIIRKILISLK